MIQTKCPQCGSQIQLPNLTEEAECPECGSKIRLHDRGGANRREDVHDDKAHAGAQNDVAQLRRQIEDLEAELERLQAKKNVFARAKVGAIQAKIQALKLEMGKLQGRERSDGR